MPLKEALLRVADRRTPCEEMNPPLHHCGGHEPVWVQLRREKEALHEVLRSEELHQSHDCQEVPVKM